MKNTSFKQIGTLRFEGVLAAVVLLIAFATIPWWMTSYALHITTRILIYSMLTLSFSFLIGQVGMLSLAQVGFFGIAGYTVALLGVQTGLAFPYLVLIGLAITFIVAAIFGLIVLRTKGIYLLMITLAFSQIVWTLARQWVSLTHGSTGIRGIPPINLAGISFSAPNSPGNFYYLVLFSVLVAFGAVFIVLRSRYGLVLRALSEEPERLNTLGYSPFWLRYSAFVFASVLAGYAGIFNVYFNGIINPSTISMTRTVWSLMVSILGGVSSLIGPLLGTTVGILLERFVAPLTERYMIVVGSVFIVIILIMREGIMGYLDKKTFFQQLKARFSFYEDKSSAQSD